MLGDEGDEGHGVLDGHAAKSSKAMKAADCSQATECSKDGRKMQPPKQLKRLAEVPVLPTKVFEEHAKLCDDEPVETLSATTTPRRRWHYAIKNGRAKFN